MRAQEEKDDGHAKEKLLGRRVLRAIVDLFPHVQVVVGSAVELKRRTAYPMEHDIRAEHVRDIRQGPRGFLGDAGDNIVEDLKGENQDEVNRPSTCMIFKLAYLTRDKPAF